jgi:uncharacterized LabA/DUF88 family protein
LPPEPALKRAVAFVDGQNLYFAARDAFGYQHPNYDVVALSRTICELQGWRLTEVHFYTGLPTKRDDPLWHRFWLHKLAAMGRKGVRVCTRPLRHRTHTIDLPDGTKHVVERRQEKGIDVRIALDIVRLTHRDELDVVLLFSQDQDLAEVAREIRSIAREQNRWLKIASAFPDCSGSRERRGIDRTDWIRIDRSTYEACLDRRRYPTP